MFQSWNPNLTRSASACQRTSDSPNSATWKRIEKISASLSEQCWAQTDLKTCLRNPPVTGCTSEYNHIQTHLRSIHMTIINVFSRLDLMILSYLTDIWYLTNISPFALRFPHCFLESYEATLIPSSLQSSAPTSAARAKTASVDSSLNS